MELARVSPHLYRGLVLLEVLLNPLQPTEMAQGFASTGS
jgi:hypothetical protein